MVTGFECITPMCSRLQTEMRWLREGGGMKVLRNLTLRGGHLEKVGNHCVSGIYIVSSK